MITEHDQEQLAQELTAARTPGARRRVVIRYARLWQLSQKSIYVHARAGGWDSGRKPRADAGTRVNDELLEVHFERVFSHLCDSKRRLKKPPIAKAIMACERAGVIPPGTITETMFGRWAKGRGIDWRGDWQKRRMRDNHVIMKAAYPQHVHQVDASLYAFWYVRDDGKLDCKDNEKTVYKNKPQDGRVRVIRWIVCDMCTHAFYVYYTTDEKTTSFAEVLFAAWSMKPRHDILPFAGMPELIYCDRHSTHWAAETQHLLSACGVKMLETMPESPRSHGAVECLHALWEEWFELDQVFDPPASIGELQERAESMCAFLNSRAHSRYGRSRSAAWHGWIAEHAEKLRLPVAWPIFQRLLQKSDERKVGGDGMISYDGKKFRVPRELWGQWGGETVQVHVSPFREGWIDVERDGQCVSVHAVAMDEWGKPADAPVIGSGVFHAAPAAPRETTLREIRERQAATVAGVGKYHDFEARIAERFAAIQPVLPPEEPELPARTFGEAQARRMILDHFDKLTAAQRAILTTVCGVQTEEEIEAAVEKIRNAG